MARKKTPNTPEAPVSKPATKRTTTKKDVPAGTSAPKPRATRPRATKPRQAAAARTPAPTTTKDAAASARGIGAEAGALDIVMIASEARPFAKTGGLADVAGALPPALVRLGHRVTLVLPRYRGVDVSGARVQRADVPFGANLYPLTFHERTLDNGVTFVLVDAPDLFDRDGLYGDARGDYADNAFRFAVLSRGALEYVRLRGVRPSVIHGHDWQAGLAPVYARTALANDPIVGGVPCVLTIHNLAFQGLFDADLMPWIGLGRDLYTPAALEFWGRASSLKGGVVFSEKITTVSPTYAREILTRAGGFGFEGILASRAADLLGILNGIDTQAWNPETDAFLPAHFSAAALDVKGQVKHALLEAARLPVTEDALTRPVIGLVSRLTDQKGFDLVVSAGESLMALDASWVMLGSGERAYERFWTDLARRYPDRVSTTIGFDETRAHLIEAGSDLFLMPSQFEPCGLNQMYSLRYGTVPVVRATGGLDDTVRDADEEAEAGTGFKFRDYSAAALVEALTRALAAFRDPARWQAIQRRGMAEDHSWDVSAGEYVKVFRGLQPRG